MAGSLVRLAFRLDSHIYRTLHVISPDVIEITGSQMVLVMKLIS
jgi:hypothetical protein